MQRLATFHSPLGDEALWFRRLRFSEHLSQPFEGEVELLSREPNIPANALLGQTVTIKLDTHAPQPRFFNAHVLRFAQIGRDGRYYVYKAELRPWFWFLQRTSDCQIFQNLSVPEIVRQIFAEHPIAQFVERLAASYPKRNYCVQYNESDFAFISRILEQEGISYWFEHENGQHKMVLGDGIGAHQPLPGYERVICHLDPNAGMTTETETISTWQSFREVLSGQVEINDYDFEKPRANLTSRSAEVRSHALGDYAIYNWPGNYVAPGTGQRYAQMQIDEMQSRHLQIHGGGSLRGIAAGRRFALTEHPLADQNQDYLVVSSEITVSESNYASGGESSWEANTHFTVLPWQANYRPPRTSERPQIPGPQTAVVVGPPGEEIWIDEHGRVKVQFHWDRYGKSDDKSSCWIRVAQPWAGVNFGMIAHPRVGQEVVVLFLDGNPDTPLIIGRVYNALSMPPWGLPANKTQTGILTRSTPKGGYDNANAIRFEDKKGEEQLWIHAEKNQDVEVENDETHWVGRDRKKTVDRDEDVTIKRDRRETVDHDETITIRNDRIERVDHNETISIGDDRNEEVGKNESVRVGDNQTLKVGKNRDKTVDGSESTRIGKHQQDKIGRNWSVKVGRMKTETVGMASMENVGLAKMSNIGAAYSLNVGASMNTIVAMWQNETVGKSKSVSVGTTYTVQAGTSGGGGGDDSILSANMTKSFVAQKEQPKESGGRGSQIIMDDKSITLAVGKSALRLDADGNIFINGIQLDFVASGQFTLRGNDLHLNPGSGGGLEVESDTATDTEGGDSGDAAAPPGVGMASGLVAGSVGPSTQTLMGALGTVGGIANTISSIAPMLTGLGSNVDKLAAASSLLSGGIGLLQQGGWGFQYGKPGGGSFIDEAQKTLSLDGALSGNVGSVMQMLANQIGQVTSGGEIDLSSRNGFVDSALAKEGAGILNNLRVRDELLRAGAPDIGLGGDPANHGAYQKAFEQYQQDANAGKAAAVLGGIFGKNEKSPISGQPFGAHLGGCYG